MAAERLRAQLAPADVQKLDAYIKAVDDVIEAARALNERIRQLHPLRVDLILAAPPDAARDTRQLLYEKDRELESLLNR